MVHGRVATSDAEKTKSEIGLALDIERVGSGSRREVARFLFLEVARSTDLIGKKYLGKYAGSSFPILKFPRQISCDQFYTY